MYKIIYVGTTNTELCGGKLYEKMQQRDDIQVYNVDPTKVNYIFNKNDIQVIYEGIDLTLADAIIVRSTKNINLDVALLTDTLSLGNTLIVDGVKRFNSNVNGKLGTSLIRAYNGCGPKTYHFKDSDNIPDNLTYPFVCKPKDGSKCKGRKVVNNKEELINYINSSEDLTIVQDKLDLIREWRVLSYISASDWRLNIIGITNKKKICGVKNTLKGSSINTKHRREIEMYLQQHVHKTYITGLVGFDIGKTSDKQYHVIEENRSPEWDRMDRLLDVSIEDMIINHIIDDIEYIKINLDS